MAGFFFEFEAVRTASSDRGSSCVDAVVAMLLRVDGVVMIIRESTRLAREYRDSVVPTQGHRGLRVPGQARAPRVPRFETWALHLALGPDKRCLRQHGQDVRQDENSGSGGRIF